MKKIKNKIKIICLKNNTFFVVETVGRPKSGPSVVNIGDGCGSGKKILHEVKNYFFFFMNQRPNLMSFKRYITELPIAGSNAKSPIQILMNL